jgi:hypothetical protein
MGVPVRHATGASGRAVHPRRRRARAAITAAVAGPAAALALAACGAGAPAPAAAPSGNSTRAYASCLLRHLGSGDGQGARRACRPLRPAGGIAPLLVQFAACLSDHGVAIPAPPPSQGAPATPGTAATPGAPASPATAGGTTAAGALKFLNAVRTGTPAERAAFSACETSL